jgi:carbon starvation protein
MDKLGRYVVWIVIAIVGAISFGMIALHRGETINAMWLVVAAVCTYMIGYRFYSLFIATKVMELNPNRQTPAYRHNDGLDYVPTNKYVLFGHHFAAIAGAGPLVGPILAAQMGYLPGTLWLLIGVVFAGAMQDFIILFISMRRDGRSLGEIIRSELGKGPGVVAMFGILAIVSLLLAVLALVVVNVMSHSPWTTFTIIITIPLAIFMGIYMRFIRPGRVLEISIFGFIVLLACVGFGYKIEPGTWFYNLLDFTPIQSMWFLVIYGFIASVLPVWFLLAPRDYLSTFLKIGTILALAVGILWVRPDLHMPALTKFIDGTGPVFSGDLFPFLFITIACGAISGFHSLISSGTTPKMLENEMNARPIGYGAMLVESSVGVMAMVAACILDPGVYFAINSPGAIIGPTVAQAAATISSWGFVVTPEQITQIAQDIHEQTVLSRTGGAPTFAIGMAVIFHQFVGGVEWMAFWYHFAVLFEALFILTTIDAGTRVARFMIQDIFYTAAPSIGRTSSLVGNLLATAIAVGLWGYILYQGVIDPNGGIRSLWSLFGIANQMLACVALILATAVLIKMKKERFVWVPLIPMLWLMITTLTAAVQKLFHSDPAIGFIAQAQQYSAAMAEGSVIGGKTVEQMQQVVFNSWLNASLTLALILIVAMMVIVSIKPIRAALASPVPTARETPAVIVNH